jgi:hypothetical protein
MENDPELSGKYLGTITKDFAVVSDTLKEASYHIRSRDISNHPIFIFAKDPCPIGMLLVGAHELNLEWHVYASFLDEFVQRGLVGKDHIQDFETAYKAPDEFCCLFVLDKTFTNFVFIPYPED